jgi:hypothetical protein
LSSCSLVLFLFLLIQVLHRSKWAQHGPKLVVLTTLRVNGFLNLDRIFQLQILFFKRNQKSNSFWLVLFASMRNQKMESLFWRRMV